MKKLKDFMTNEEYTQVRRLQLELLKANSKKEAVYIRGEIEWIIQQVKMRCRELNKDENAASAEQPHTTKSSCL